MYLPKTNYAKIAFDAILFYVTTNQVRKEKEEKISADLKLNLACIVSIYDNDNNLLSLYGNIKPEQKNLYDEIIENALKAASGNKKYSAVDSSKLNQVKVFVDVVSDLHKVEEISELKPKKHGVYIKKGEHEYYILPDTKGIKTPEQLIEELMKKAGIKNAKDFKDEIHFFKTTRYE